MIASRRERCRHHALGLVLVAGAFLVGCFPLVSTDIWWHLAAGREILATGSVPSVDRFSVSSYGQPWVDLHWLFQVIAYAAHAAGGITALVLGKCALTALGAWLLLLTVETGGDGKRRWGVVAALVVMLVAARPLLLARPVIVTLVCLGLFLLVLERFRRRGGWWPLLCLPVAQVVWSNAQPLFILGPLMVTCYAVGESLWRLAARRGLVEEGLTLAPGRLRQLWVALSLVALACLATPYGWEGVLLPFRMFGRIDPRGLFSSTIAENIPPWELERLGVDTFWAFKYVAAAIFGSFLLGLRRACLSRFLLAAAFFITALMANRNILLFYWVGVPVALLVVGDVACSRPGGSDAVGWWGRSVGALRRGVAWLLERPWPALVALGGCAVFLAAAVRQEGALSAPAPFRVPTEAVSRVREVEPAGHLFCSVRYGGYLAWTLGQERLPVIDGRLILRTTEQFAAYLEVLREPTRFEAYRRAHGVSVVVLPAVVPPHYRALVDHLYASPSWRLVETDGTEVLFVEDWEGGGGAELVDGGAVERITSDLARRYAGAPRIREQALVNLGALLSRFGHQRLARDVLARLPSDDARVLEARSAYLDHDRAAARALALALLERRPEEVNTLTLLALLARDDGDAQAAVGYLARAVAVDPYHQEARRLLAEIRGARAAP